MASEQKSSTGPGWTPGFELCSPRLVLRAAREEDAADLHKAFSDPEVMRYWSTLPHANLTETQKWVRGMVEAPCNGVTDFIVCLRVNPPGSNGVDHQTNRGSAADRREEALLPIGKAGVWRDHEIGFMLARAHWGRGLAAEALALVLDHLLLSGDGGRGRGHGDVGNKQLVVADVDPRNSASLALLTRLGFEQYEFRKRTFQVSGQWVDSVYLRLTGETWARVRGKEGTRNGSSGSFGQLRNRNTSGVSLT